MFKILEIISREYEIKIQITSDVLLVGLFMHRLSQISCIYSESVSFVRANRLTVSANFWYFFYGTKNAANNFHRNLCF